MENEEISIIKPILKEQGQAIESIEHTAQLMAMEVAKVQAVLDQLQIRARKVEEKIQELAERMSGLERDMGWVKALLLILVALQLSQMAAITAYFFKQMF